MVEIDELEMYKWKRKGYLDAFGGSDMPPRGAGRRKWRPSGLPDGFD